MPTLTTHRFDLGRPLVTPAALGVIAAAGCRPDDLLLRHARGEWGIASRLDRIGDEDGIGEAIEEATAKIVSVYRVASALVMVVTQRAPARTTILLPEELPA